MALLYYPGLDRLALAEWRASAGHPSGGFWWGALGEAATLCAFVDRPVLAPVFHTGSHAHAALTAN